MPQEHQYVPRFQATDEIYAYDELLLWLCNSFQR